MLTQVERSQKRFRNKKKLGTEKSKGSSDEFWQLSDKIRVERERERGEIMGD